MLEFSKWKRSIEIYDGPDTENANPHDQDETEHVSIGRIKGPWHPSMPEFLVKKGVKGISLYHGDGFICDDYEFLKELGHLELFSMLAPSPYDYSDPIPFSKLTRLRRLSAPFRHQHPLEFSELNDLRSCTIKWSKEIDGIFQSKLLKRLQMKSLDWRRADGLANLQSLENLEISHSDIRSFASVKELTKLKRLSLQVCHRLEDLDGIEALQDLRCLQLGEIHKVTSLERLAALENLEVLTIVDGREIQSIAPLEGLKNLKALWIAGTNTTIVDGDLTPLTRLPNLAMLTLGKKRHYSHKVIKKWSWDNLEAPDKQLELT